MRGPSSRLLPIAGYVLAAGFAFVAIGSIVDVLGLKRDLTRCVEGLALLNAAQANLNEVTRTELRRSAETTAGAEPAPWGEASRKYRENLADLVAHASDVAELPESLERLRRSLERLGTIRGEIVGVPRPKDEVDAWKVRFSEEASEASLELSSAAGLLRARSRTKEITLSRRMSVVYGMLLGACALSVTVAVLLRRRQTELGALRTAQASLVESRMRLDTVIANTPVILWSVDKNGIIRISEGRGLEGLGLRAGELVGKSVYALYGHQPSAMNSIRRALRGETVTDEVTEAGRAFRSIYLPLLDERREIDGVTCVSTDVTELARAEETLQRSLEARRESLQTEAIGRVASGLSHEFSNLLTVISGFATLALDGIPVGERARRDIEQVLRAADRAALLVQEFLIFSGRKHSAPQLLDLNRAILDLQKLLRTLLGERVRLVLDLCEGEALVLVDPSGFEHVVMNLALNARDAMPSGGVFTIRSRAEDPTTGSSAGTGLESVVRLRFSDTGCGMSEETRQRVFEPFFTTKPQGQGTGLGLSTCRGLVAQAGGTIELRSRIGEGTTVEVVLQRASGAERGLEADALALDAPLRGSETVLLVEDEELLRGFGERVLEDLGYRVLSAPNGPAALRLLDARADPIDLLVTDCVMPEMSGQALSEEVRRRLPRCPVLFVSGYPGEERGLAASEEERNLLAKPFSPEDLASAVRRRLDRGGSRGSEAPATKFPGLVAGALAATEERR